MMSDDKPDSPNGDERMANADEAPAGADDARRSAWAEKGQAAELETLKTEAADLKDRLLRAMADMENLRRRTEREKADTAKYAISAFARDMLTVADNLGRAIAAVPREAVEGDAPLKALLEGVEVTERDVLNALERHGIRKLEPKGERFDPNLHQAMLQREDKAVPAGTVLDVLQPGYVIGDRVLRPALVSVSTGGERPARADDDPVAANNNETRQGPPGAEGKESPASEAGSGDDEPSSGDDGEPPASDGSPIGGRVDRSA